MSRFINDKLSFVIIILLMSGCATYDAQYHENAEKWKEATKDTESEIAHTFYLIGDGGGANNKHIQSNFEALKTELSSASKNSTVLYLGDNTYKKGMPNKTDPDRLYAEQSIDTQLSIVKEFNGNTIFIPGNHDYYNDGIIGLKREQEYIAKQLDDKISFLPKNGCPIDEIDISNEIVLILVDSQWYLEDWDKNLTMNNQCEIKTRERFFSEFEALIKKNDGKIIFVALHHPMYSNGSHGGQYSLKQQLFPINNKIPLPVAGSFINLLRKTSGAYPQDLQNPIYLKYQKRITTISQKAEKVIFLSGHEHSLQYLEHANKVQIISGSGSTKTATRVTDNGVFSYGGIGYAKIEVLKNGASWVYYYSESDKKQNLLFRKEIYPKNPEIDLNKYSDSFPKTIKTSVYTHRETNKGPFYKRIWGEHYRDDYSTRIEAKTVLLDTLYGGLTPIRKGDGQQSRSIRLKDKDGREYTMRALRKSTAQYFQEVAFKDQYIDEQFIDTYTEELLLDIYTIAHPYASFTNAILSDAVGLYHTNPKLFYVPKQNRLGKYNKAFGDELYMIEELVFFGHENVERFGYSNKIINTQDLLHNLKKSDKHVLDETMYIRARLFDMAIGDWNRYEDQWCWTVTKKDEKTIYRPIPRGRDKAFSTSDGFALKTVTALVREFKLMQEYKPKMKSVKWFNIEAFPLDISLTSESTIDDWLTQAKFLQEHLTPEIIDSAFKQMPYEVQGETTKKIKKIFLERISNLQKVAKKYYEELHKNAVIKGTDEDNVFDVNRLANGDTTIKIFNIKEGSKDSKIFEKTYLKGMTKEIWMYGLRDKDIFNVNGEDTNVIRLRIIGGQNNDTYNIESGKKVIIYDFNSKKNTFTTDKGTVYRLDDYSINTYDYKRLKSERNIIIPKMGANPDDGFRIGVKNSFYKYGFNGNPYTQLYNVDFNYYFATSGYDVKFDMEIGNIIHNWNFNLFSQFTSTNYSVNFFGWGNETINDDDALGKEYYRVKTASFTANPSLKWTGRMGSILKLGALFQTAEVEKTTGRFIENIPDVSDERQDFVGVNAIYKYENYDNKALQTMGMKFAVETGWKTNLGIKAEHNAYIRPELSFNHKLTPEGKVVLATKFKGNIIIGDHFQFYNAASIGGKDGLRGFRNQRFTGNRSYYQNTDIRYKFDRIKTPLLPLELGMLAGFDYGRVWLNSEESTDWKTSYGVGFWAVGAKLINLNFYIFNSNEGAYIRFGMGFGF